MERGMRPSFGRIYQAMFHRVEMNILNVLDEVILIPDLMFPKTVLPDGLFACAKKGIRLTTLEFITAFPAEITLYLPPPHREIGIVFRQGPNTMEMIGQQHKSIYGKGVASDNMLKGFPDQLDLRFVTQKPLSPVGHDGKEKSCSFCPRSPVLHGLPSALSVNVSGFAVLYPTYYRLTRSEPK